MVSLFTSCCEIASHEKESVIICTIAILIAVCMISATRTLVAPLIMIWTAILPRITSVAARVATITIKVTSKIYIAAVMTTTERTQSLKTTF